MAPLQYTLTFESLSPDCFTVRPGQRGTRDNLDSATVRACLEAFAAIPSVNLVDVDAKLRLRSGLRQVVVGRSGNAFYFTPMPEASNTPVPSTADGVMAYMEGIDPVAPAPAPAEPADEPQTGHDRPARQGLFRLSLGAQVAVLAVTLSVATSLAYQVAITPPPAGYTLLTNDSRGKELHRQLDGEYGDAKIAESVSFRIAGGKISIFYTPAPEMARELVRSNSFRLAERGGSIVALLVANGDILELQPDGSLLYADQTYRKVSPR